MAYEIENLKRADAPSRGLSPLSAPAKPRVSPSYTAQPSSAKQPKKQCPHCGANNNVTNTTCFACGEKLE